MSKKKKEPFDLDKIVKSAELDDHEFKPEDAFLPPIKPIPESGKLPEEVLETLRATKKDAKDK